VDAVFNDILGGVHHCTFDADECKESSLTNGFPFDGSSLPMFQRIGCSDLLMKPDPSQCWIDPFAKHTTLRVICSVVLPDGSNYSKCPREILRRSRDLLVDDGFADRIYLGPEAEFFVFESARFDLSPQHTSLMVDTEEAYWNSHSVSNTQDKNTGGNFRHRLPLKKAYLADRPFDIYNDLRSDMLLILKSVGVHTEKHHHEVATGQMEIGTRFSDVLMAADNLLTLKYVTKNVASAAGKTVTFMPKPLSGDNGSGMHCNVSLWKDGANCFYDPTSKYAELSDTAIYFIGGLLLHAPAVFAFTNPTVNSYRRLVPGFEAPINLTYSVADRSAAVRIPECANDSAKSKRVEFRSPDASGSPYLAFAAIVMAGLDGLRNKIVPPDCVKGEIADNQKVRISPTSLEEAMSALEADHDFLLSGDVFSEAFIETYIAFKRDEAISFRSMPHPRDFQLYYGC